MPGQASHRQDLITLGPRIDHIAARGTSFVRLKRHTRRELTNMSPAELSRVRCFVFLGEALLRLALQDAEAIPAIGLLFPRKRLRNRVEIPE